MAIKIILRIGQSQFEWKNWKKVIKDWWSFKKTGIEQFGTFVDDDYIEKKVKPRIDIYYKEKDKKDLKYIPEFITSEANLIFIPEGV